MSGQKIKVTSEQLGQLLFGFVSTHTTGRLKDAEYLRSLGVDQVDQKYLLREMLLINMFAIVQGLNGLLDDDELETKVLDHMHKTYYQSLVEYLGMKPVDFPNEHAHLLERYQEYDQAMQEKRGPNWLWPLTHHMLNRLRQEDTTDAVAMFPLSADISFLMKELPGLINQYEIAENWN
jgi:hypothetical protein